MYIWFEIILGWGLLLSGFVLGSWWRSRSLSERFYYEVLNRVLAELGLDGQDVTGLMGDKPASVEVVMYNSLGDDRIAAE